jgi:hypothetical protein
MYKNSLTKALGSLVVAASATLMSVSAFAGAIHDSTLFTTVLPANDDGSTGLVNLGFTALINATSYTQTYVNNNGNITFNGALNTYTPAAINSGSFGPIIAAFFADVDTRAAGSNPVTYGSAVLNGKNVFGVNYIKVGVYNSNPIFNSFQMILTDRSDVALGDFDIQFNYDTIVWDQGSVSSTSALAGYWTSASSNYTLAGSLVSGALRDGGSNALISGSLNSNVAGQYNFEVRGGSVVSTVPEPSALALVGLALAGLALASRKRNAA